MGLPILNLLWFLAPVAAVATVLSVGVGLRVPAPDGQ